MLKYFDHKVLKTAFGSFLAYYLADYFGLRYGLTVSIVTIISIQETKVESFKITIERILAGVLGLGIFALLAKILGFTYITLGIFILLFMPLCMKFKLMQGFLATTVLGTHILSEKSIAFSLLKNELSILILGLLIGNILNMYMPTKEKTMEKLRSEIEKIIKNILLEIAESLKCSCVSVNEDKNFKKLRDLIDEGKKLAIQEFNNNIFDKINEELILFSMRKEQYGILKRVRIYFGRLYLTMEHSIIISQFIEKVANNIEIDKDLGSLFVEHKKLVSLFSTLPLPKTREEFENRATLYQLLKEMSEIIELQREYKEEIKKIEVNNAR